MLVGTADVQSLAQRAATIESFVDAPVRWGEVICFQVVLEMRNRAREAVLPPGLHPTVPAALSLQAWSVGQSEWGAFRMVVARVSCRSGVRARGFTTGVLASTASAAEGLRGTFGYPAKPASINFRHSYDGVDLAAVVDDKEVVAVKAIDPEPMAPSDVQYTGTMNLAHTPKGLRLIQLEADHQLDRVERLQAALVSFDGAAFGNELLKPYQVVSASLASGSVTIAPIRFVCRPDELAFSGTEAV